MKKILKHIILLLWVVLPLEVMAFSTWDGTSTAAWTKGNGTSSAPYIIETAEHLAYLAQQVNAGNTYSGKYFKMTADIDLCGYQWTPIGTASTPFSGKFDGAHHIVYNLYMNDDINDFVGLFGYIKDGGLGSIAVENCHIEVHDHASRSHISVGTVAAYVINSGSLDYCYATGKTNVINDPGDECSPYNYHYTIIGGVFGRLEDTDVSYCYNAVNMTEGTHRDIGGVIGSIKNSDVDKCYNVGDVRGLFCRAGIVGWSLTTDILNENNLHYCYNMGRITTCQPIGTTADANNYNGGIIACASYTTIRNCYSMGYMDEYPGGHNPSFAIAKSADFSAPRLSNFSVNTLNTTTDFNQSGSRYPAAFFKGTNGALLLLGNKYQLDTYNTNSGNVIHQQSVYNTETCGAALTGDSKVTLEASVYAHNKADRGILFGTGEDMTQWAQNSTKDSILNHLDVKDLEHNVKYGYAAYQLSASGYLYGDDKYFMLMDADVCQGEKYDFKGRSYPAGQYMVTDRDTTFFLHLAEIEKPVVTLPEVSVCYEYTWEGQTTKQTTVLKTVVKSVLCGCDSTTYQPVTIKDSVVVELPRVTECYEYTWKGQTTKVSARLRRVDTGINGCDSITYQPVIIKDSVVVTLPEVENCYNYEWEGQTTKKDTIFRKVDIGSNGCDSITYQPVIIKDSVVVTLPEVENCYEYTWEGQTTKKSAKLRKVDVGANGCDSITYQPVIIKDSVVVTLPEVENCYEYTWEGQTTKKSAKLRRVDIGVNGCDSITYQPVIIKDSVVVTLPEVENCYEYTWEGQTTKKSARLRRVDVGANGCDSITYQPVIIKDSVVVTLPEVENCYEYTWEGQTTKKSAKLRRVDIGVNGCDSITYQPVIIKDSVVVTLPEVENCYEYTWEGQTTKKSAKLRKVDVGVNGCDSITYQPVIIKDSVVVHLPDVEACGEYTWHEMTVKESATLRYETVGSNQCDSITYLYVDISYDTSTAVEDTVKFGHTYQKKGFDLPEQREIGEFVFEKTVHTVKGCDSTVVLTLHVIPDRDLPLKPASYVVYKDGRFNWQIENVENFPNVYVEIYDRFGRRVAMYHGYDNNNGWNGYYNGHILPSTDYWYYIRDDIFGSMSGHFTLYYKQGQW